MILHVHQRTPQNVYKIVINGCDTVPRWSFAVRLGSKQFCRNLYQEIIIAMYFINNGNAVKMLHKIYEQQQQIQHNMFINEFWCYFFSSFIHIMSVLFFYIFISFLFLFPKYLQHFRPLNGCAWSVYLHNRTITEKRKKNYSTDTVEKK